MFRAATRLATASQIPAVRVVAAYQMPAERISAATVQNRNVSHQNAARAGRLELGVSLIVPVRTLVARKNLVDHERRPPPRLVEGAPEILTQNPEHRHLHSSSKSKKDHNRRVALHGYIV